MNILEHLDSLGQISFDDQPFSPIDALLLTEIGYLLLDEIVPYSFDPATGLSFEQVYQAFKVKEEALTLKNQFLVTKNRVDLLAKIAQSPRYSQIKLFGHTNEVDYEHTKQFAALIQEFHPGMRLVVFRGTDDSVIGWKEDFQMTYQARIPAQESAAAYFAKQARDFEGDFYISGHSKGGNLALYAGAMQEPGLRQRIQQIFCFDSPGFHPEIIQTPGYQELIPKVFYLIPQDSIVGRMLEAEIPYHIVYSLKRGVDQHDSFNWQIQDGHFQIIDYTTRSSQVTDQTLKKWVASLSQEELAFFFDTFFDVFFEIGVQSVNDLQVDFLKVAQKYLDQTRLMDVDTRKEMIRIAWMLVELRSQVWMSQLTNLPNEISPPFEQLEQFLSTWTHKPKPIQIDYEENEDNESIRHYYQQRHKEKRM